MCFFKKRKVADKTKYDRDLIETNSKAVDALIVLAKDDSVLVEVLKGMQEKIKYLTPSNNSKVIHFDEIIKNKIGDVRIALTKVGRISSTEQEELIKSDSKVSKEVDELIVEIKLALADRNTRL